MTPFKPVSRAFEIESLAYPFERNFSSKFIFDGELHDFIELVYIKSGAVEVVKEETIYLVDGGTILFHAPMEFHKIKSAKGTSPKVYNLSMRVRGALPDGIYDHLFSLDLRLEERFISAFSKARDFLEESAPKEIGQLATLELEALIIDICRSSAHHGKVLSTSAAKAYRAVIEAMEREIYSNVSLEEIAGRVNISRSYLKSLFSKFCDLSPKEYYRKLRLREAMRLLAEGASVSKIAEMMNFSYPNHFTQFFKNETGLSPTEYRARL